MTLAPRLMIALSLIATWGSLGRVLRVQGVPHPRGLSAWIDLGWLVTPLGAGLMTGLFAAATLAFVLRRGEGVAATALVVLLAVGGHVQEAQWPVGAFANRSLVLPGAALAVYGVARLLALRAGAPRDQADAWGLEAACGVAAACYTLAGLNKLVGSGAAWAGGSNLAMHISVHAHGGLEGLRAARLAVADSLGLCTLFGVGTLVIESSFLLFVLPRLRRGYALAAAAMHLGIAAVLGLHHYDWMFMVLGLGFAARPTGPWPGR